MAEADSQRKINRQEFLNLAWLASLGFLLVDLGAVTYLFSLPRFREGEFGGRFDLGQEALPAPGSGPLNYPAGRFWLVQTADSQVLALYKVCTHLGCLYGWLDENDIYRCPCHGSQFQLDGTYIQGPAPRSLDRFVIRLLDEASNEVAVTDPEGNALPLPEQGVQVVVETGQRIQGKPKGQTYPTSG